MAEDFCVFVSGVTSEFGKVREAIAAALRARAMIVKEQHDFRPEPFSSTTLKLLHDYIAICDAVVYVMGVRSGDKPPPASAAEFARMLPPNIREATYTEWEFYFARHFSRPMFVYVAKPAYTPDQAAPTGADYPEFHEAFRHYIFDEQDTYRLGFDNAKELCEHVERADWDSLRVTKGWSQEKFFVQFLKDRSLFFFGRNWLFADIAKWRSETGHGERMMLVTGTPGIGKSSVVARFLDQTPCGKILAHHCFLHTQKETTQLDGFVRNIAFQLAQNLRSYREILVRPDMRQSVRELDSSDEEGPGDFFRNAIFGVLQTLEKPAGLGDGPAWIVVDAFDEAIDRADPEYDDKRHNIASLIEAALKLLPPWLRILATSRRDDLTDRLGQLYEKGRPLVHQIYLDDENRPEDATMYRDYIAARLADGPQLSEDVGSHLVQQSEGNFLYLKLVLDQIAAGAYGVKEIRALPRGLPSPSPS
ncbi:MAG TPA: ATP-binding protein, partial [Xanthobacteraceae bacterium]|nr:ATP-binding protein [Xanthobacteraceae bacterium]